MENNFYCQKICGEVGFSIDEWNKDYVELEKSGLSQKEKDAILHPPKCKEQCFDCMAIVGKRQKETAELLKNKEDAG